jgi:hypothetical protein
MVITGAAGCADTESAFAEGELSAASTAKTAARPLRDMPMAAAKNFFEIRTSINLLTLKIVRGKRADSIAVNCHGGACCLTAS